MPNSATCPLRIEAVRAPGGGEVGMTMCPGKKQLHAQAGTWERDLDADIKVIIAWGASVVVTLIEDGELEDLKVTNLGNEVERHSIDWHHLPIPDYGTPDSVFEDRWVYSGHRLRQLLRASKKLLVHCRGGLGRSGMIAARLLVELGVKPGTAIRDVRAARPGAIENRAQERHVGSCKPMLTDSPLVDRILGCLLGGAVGDALGYEVEFDRWSEIQKRFGKLGITEPHPHEGKFLVSDDTQMTLFTLEGMLQSGWPPKRVKMEPIVESIRRSYMDWLNTQGEKITGWKPAGTMWQDVRLKHRRAPGNTCLGALRKGGKGSPENALNDSKGCGGVMRVAPIGLLPGWPPEEVAPLAARAAALTHGHPSGYLSAAAMAAVVSLALDGAELGPAAERASKIVSEWKGADETITAIEAALDAASARHRNHIEAVSALGEGWVGEEALAIGLYAAMVGKSFPETLRIAANHDGDSDSTASIAGQLYGAANGLADLPNAWVRRLDVLDVLLGLVRRIVQ